MNSTCAIIFSAGKGLRLRPLTEKIPKPLLEIINGKCLLDFTLESLLEIGIHDIFINYSYAGDLFHNFREEYKDRCKIILIEESEPLGQGGTILKNVSQLRNYDKVICSNGDTYAHYDRKLFLYKHESLKSSLTILSDNSKKLPREILSSYSNHIKGCRINSKPYYYKKTFLNINKRVNYLGEFVFNPNDIPSADFTEEFRGLFGSDDLIEILQKNGKKTMVYSKKIDYFLSMNTLEEYENVKNFCNKSKQCLNILKSF